ncbi:MAG: SPOR domain-containing protein [Desulfobacterales bacterium]|jgi:cell division septation protein DedD
MKKKTVSLLAWVVFIILAVYAVWHYSPLRHLTKSKSQPEKIQLAALGAKNQPVIVRKKIPPRSDTAVQEKDIPQALIVLKDLVPKQPPKPVDQKKLAAETATQKNKILVLEPDGNLRTKKSAPQEAQSDDASKTIAKKTETAPLEQKSYHPYSILLSSCRLPQSARKIVTDYQKVGLAPYVAKVEFKNGDVWLRVFAGHYQTRAEALTVKQKHHLSKAIVKKTPYTNLIDTFSSKDEVNDALRRLKDLGYSPYVLKRAENRFHLVVGAFITREGAEKQKSELESKGISNQIVQR